MSELLAYLVKAVLDGEGEKLKGYAIGVDVFDRPEDFDPSTDSIVRVQTGRLRRLLDEHYLGDGAHDPVRITIKKGQYAPTFAYRPVPSVAEAGPGDEGPAAGRQAVLPAGYWIAVSAVGVILLAVLFTAVLSNNFLRNPDRAQSEVSVPGNEDAITVAVLPLKESGHTFTDSFLADGITDELIRALSRIPTIDVVTRTSASGETRDSLDADYVLEGSLQRVEGRFRVNVQLTALTTGRTIWAEDYERRDADIFDVQDEIVLALASELRPQLLGAASEALSNKPTDEQTAWELYLQAMWTPGVAVNSQAWEVERAALAEQAIALQPDFGPAHAILAEKYAYLANMVPELDTPDRAQEAALHARRAIELAPEDADALFGAAMYYWHAGNFDRADAYLDRLLELDPSHPMARFMSYSARYTCSRTPRQVIDRMIAYDRSLSPDNPVRWVVLTWIAQSHLNNGDYQLAAEYAETSTRIFRTPDSVYRLATALVQIGETGQAYDAFLAQKEFWPDLDPHHYASTVVARRCEGEALKDELVALYQAMADAVEQPA